MTSGILLCVVLENHKKKEIANILKLDKVTYPPHHFNIGKIQLFGRDTYKNRNICHDDLIWTVIPI